MKEIYDEYFRVPKEGRVREKVLFGRITVSVIVMLVWLSAMGFTAYAYFTSSVTSGMNTIASATYSLKVEEASNKAIADAENKNKFTLPTAGTYDFTLTKEGTANTGYCKILIGGNNENAPIITEQIGVVTVGETPVESRTIRIGVMEETVVEFVACWGTYAGEPLKDASEMIIVENQKVEIGGKQEVLIASETSDTKQSNNTQSTTLDTSYGTTANKSESAAGNETPDASTNVQTGTSTDIQNNITNTQSGTTTEETTGAAPDDSNDTTQGTGGASEDTTTLETKVSEPTS